MYKPELSISIGCLLAKGLNDGVYRYEFDPSFEQSIIDFKAMGVNAIELDVCGMAYASIFEEYAQKACEIALKHGMRVHSVHVPFGSTWVDLASPWEGDRKAIVAWFKRMFSILDKYGVKAYIFHPGGNNCTEEKHAEFMEKLIQSADEMAESTSAYVCIENMTGGALFNTLEKVMKFCDKAKKAKIVVDLNHFLHDNPITALKTIGANVKAIHVSDYDFVCERHMMPGEGKNDWQGIIAALEQICFEGTFNYEVKWSLGYTGKQIKENYEKLFEEYNAK